MACFMQFLRSMKLFQNIWLRTFIMVVFGGATPWVTPSLNAEEKPNIVLILADDVGREVLGSYGGQSYDTPYLDKLAHSGMRFTHAYSMPVCHPTRLTLLTGKYPFRFGAPKWGTFPESAENETVAHLMRKAGYQTAVAGKWQLTLLGDNPDHPRELGFDQWCLFGWHEGPRYDQPLIWENGKQSVRDGYGPDIYCDFLIEFMRKNHDRPFFAFYSMALSHDVSDDFLPRPPYAPGKDRYDSYEEMVHAMDLRVGRITEALSRLELDRKTLVIFIADNGTPVRVITQSNNGMLLREPVISTYRNQPMPGGKGTLTDAGTRVPMIAWWPGKIAQNQVCDDLVDMSDFLPTFASFAGMTQTLPDQLDGVSFANQLMGKSSSSRDWVYAERRNKWYIRNQAWKLYQDDTLFQMGDNEEHPFDLNAHPVTSTGNLMFQRFQQVRKSLGLK